MPKIQLHNCDCLELLKTLPDNSVDLFLQDPPYNTTACKWEYDLIPLLPELWEQWLRVGKENCVIALFADEPFTSRLILSNIDMFRYRITWDKMVGGSPLNSHKMPLKQTEDICIFSPAKLGNHTYNPQMGKKHKADVRPIGERREIKASTYGKTNGGYSESYVKEEKRPTTLISFHAKEGECNGVNRVHETQKPIKLMEYLIKSYSNEGDTVFDGYAGSGATAFGCSNTNRSCITSELNKKKFDSMQQRFNLHASQSKLF